MQQLKEDYSKLFPLFFEEFPHLFQDRSNYTFDLYKWAVGTIWSRAFDVKIKKKKTRVLAPFADMFNHNPTVVEEHKFDENTNHLICKTSTLFKKGEQVFINYGSFPNHKLLRLYGFSLQNNPHDTVEIWAPMSPQAPLYDLKMEILNKHGISNEQAFDLRNGKVPTELFGTLRVQRAEALEFVHIDKAFTTPISPQNEVLVLDSLIAALQSMLSQYSTSIESDQKLIEDRKIFERSPKRAFAIILRMSEQEILRRDLQLLQVTLILFFFVLINDRI